MPEIVSQGSGPIPTSPGSPTLSDLSSSDSGSSDAPTPFEDNAFESGDQGGGRESHSNGQQDSGAGESDKPQSAAQKRESRYERTKRQRAQFNAERAAFEQQKQAWEQQRQAAEEAKKPKFDLNELKRFREEWKTEGNWDLVEKADAKIAELEKEALNKNAQTNKVQTWRQAERELSANDPDFLKQGTRLDTRIRQIMGSADGDIYRGHERGIVAAYHRAKMELLQEDFNALQKEHQALQQEHQRVTGLTSISGGTPGRMGNGQKDFASMSSGEMRKHLARRASNTPWI